MQSLPPKLRGAPRGLIQLSFAPLAIATETTEKLLPPHERFLLRFRWWGAEADYEVLLPSDPTSPVSIQARLCAPFGALDRYFADSDQLEIFLFAENKGEKKAIGKGAIRIHDAWKAAAQDGSIEWRTALIALEGTNGSCATLPWCLAVVTGAPAPGGAAMPTAEAPSPSDEAERRVRRALEGYEDATERSSLTKEGERSQGAPVVGVAGLAQGNPSAVAAVAFGSPTMMTGTLERIDQGVLPGERTTTSDHRPPSHDTPSCERESVDAQNNKQSCQQGRDGTEDEEGAVLGRGDRGYRLHVRIESAFQLPSSSEILSQGHAMHKKTATHEDRYMAFASVMMQRCRDERTFTHPATVVNVPGIGGRTAVWNSEISVPVHNVAAFFDTDDFAHHFLETMSNDPGKEASDAAADPRCHGPLLVVHVWRHGGLEKDHVLRLATMSLAERQRAPAQWSPQDVLIGSAAIDLRRRLFDVVASDALSSVRDEVNDVSPSKFNRDAVKLRLQGRFPLVDAKHQVKGTLKLAVVPNDALQEVLRKMRSSRIQRSPSSEKDRMDHTKESTTAAPREGQEEAKIEREAESNGGGDGGASATDAADGSSSPHAGAPQSIADASNAPEAKALLDDGVNLLPTMPRTSVADRKRSERGGVQSKERYAWSGSDSDDDAVIDVVGVCFEGAVSCSDEEEALGDSSGHRPEAAIEKNHVRGGVDTDSAAAKLLVTEDWMFDIGKPNHSKDVQGSTSRNQPSVAQPTTPNDASDAAGSERRKVAFKNKLPCAYVEPSEPTCTCPDEAAGNTQPRAPCIDQDRDLDSFFLVDRSPAEETRERDPGSSLDAKVPSGWRFHLGKTSISDEKATATDRMSQCEGDAPSSSRCDDVDRGLAQFAPMRLCSNPNTQDESFMDNRKSNIEDPHLTVDQDRPRSTISNSTRAPDDASDRGRRRLMPTLSQILRNRTSKA